MMWSFKLSVGLSLLLSLRALAESKNAIDVFKRADALTFETVERNVRFTHPRKLVKRASPYLTDATQSKL